MNYIEKCEDAIKHLPKAEQDYMEAQHKAYIAMHQPYLCGVDLSNENDITVTMDGDSLIEKIKRHEPITSDDAKAVAKDLEQV